MKPVRLLLLGIDIDFVHWKKTYLQHLIYYKVSIQKN
jgi:hypothetical protein